MPEEQSSVSIQILKDSIYSEETKRVYVNCIKAFVKHFNVNEFDDLLTYDKIKTTDMIRKFILYIRNERKLSHGRMNVFFAAFKLYYEQNDYPHEISWSKLVRFKGKNNGKKVQDRTYTREEIQLMIEHADVRMKVIISTMLSSGIRVGGLAGLRLKDLTYIEDYKLFRMTIYSDSPPDQYYTFTTPECANFINLYFQYRMNQGEKLSPESPLIRQKFHSNESENGIELTTQDIQERVRYFFRTIGITENKPVIRNSIKIYTDQEKLQMRKHRNQVMRCHGLRKFFNTVCIESDMNIVSKELLMGHKKNLGLEKSYYRPTSDTILNEYLKVIDNLTINDENRVKLENTQLKHRSKAQEERLTQLEERFEQLTAKFDR